SKADLFDYSDDDDDDDLEDAGFSAFGIKPGSSSAARETREVNEVREVKAERVVVQPEVKEEPKQEEKPKHVWKKYVRPTLDLLDDYPESNNVNTGEIDDNKRTIVETLARFKINSEVSNVIIGPAVTRYDVIIEDKTKIKQSLNYREAVAMALMKENVQAYLNFSKGALSIEVPNNKRSIVGLKGMLASPAFINSKSNTITFALGKNVEGEVMCPDITKMPHLLVAGTTGSGKSICLSALLISLLYKYGPEELRLILVDPKQVEFISYDKLPHLMINEIISDVDKAIKALNWAIKEMERRYSLFKDMTENGTATKNLDEYNAHIAEGEEKLPKIVIILDEFGDLMLQAKKDIESRIIKLVQKARACGIHLILATQRPSVDCITGLIKSNLPTRIGFKVNSFDDARTIFDVGGAEKLLGKGDLYFRSAEKPELSRIQGCFVDTHEVQRVTDFVKAHNETYFDQSVSDFINTVEVEESSSSGGDDGGAESEAKIDETFIKALQYCINSNQASVSMIQRRFPVGYIKACKIIDWMENMNYITHSEGSKPRKILLTREEFIKTFGDMDD
ncbi:MAG: DNA translocase FtsK, partial [Clostridia bacterium]|nr:DNA translocase FtsK [Clostridia bacterium]